MTKYTVTATVPGSGKVQYEQTFLESVFPDAYDRAERNMEKIAGLFPGCHVFLSSEPENLQDLRRAAREAKDGE